ncbi:DUF421 domain-containing protein [Halobacillus shinanisalinarum]|uniref:DUF421 domain-containing protein n=1 Tax=Halobacillus shinanisalinarum TaxID=2932258 RepID=A0ABY4H1Q2_9BACI|nr:DUF421 domain-containing protein [Halobacillus shinanisalinarum]UOQ93845.1 DUF421 domain-containing protein [Halobacillus shinanisalinarum]
MFLGTIIVRTIITYLIILIVFRLMGKREIGELSVMDLVVFIIFGEIAVSVIEEPTSSMLNALVPIFILLLIQWGSAIFSLKSQRFRSWFDGRPSVLIKHGKIDEKEMRKQRYNFSDLLLQLREQGIQQVDRVAYAVLEPSGKLSVFEKERDGSSGYAVILIADGKVQYSGLKTIRKNKHWLMNEVKKRGYTSFEEISLCSINDKGELWLDEEDEYTKE